jgi:predicted permease
METLRQDVRYGLRLLARSPGFTAIVIIVLAVGIGANTAVFSVVHAVVLRPLPYEDPGGLVVPWEKSKGMDFGTSVQHFNFLREQNEAFEYLAGYNGPRFYVTGVARPQQIKIIAASSSLFPLLGVRPLLGRTFEPAEEQPGNDHVVVLSHAFWQEQLGAAPDVVGKTLNLDERSCTIIGVMPPEFRFPLTRSAAFWVPLVPNYHIRLVARLKQGVTVEQAAAQMAVLADRLQKLDPVANAELTAGVDRLQDRALQGKGRLLWLMLGVAGCVLLIACGNVANLFLARAGARQREVAMRVALGASRRRVVRQMLTESLVLSLGAGLLGLAVTFVTVKGLVALCPADIPRLQETRVDGAVLWFTLGVSILTGLLFGMVPAWRASDIRTAEALKEGRGASAGGRGTRLRGSLVVAQIAISLVLLMGAGLLVRTLIALQQMDLGFRPENVLVVHLDLPRVKYPEDRHCQAFFEPLERQVRALPGVRAASVVSGALDLGSGGGYIGVWIDDEPFNDPKSMHEVRCMSVRPGFFEAMGMRLIRGRVFTDDDAQGPRKGVVIDENLARSCFPDTDPLGHKVMGLPVIGVVSTFRDFEALNPTHSTLFVPLIGNYFQISDLVVRTEGDPMRWADAIRARISALDKDQTAVKLETLETILSRMLAPRRFTMVLLGLFSAIALALATIGVYGLLQYSTTQQTHDIGIRMALGARKIDVLRAVVAQGLRLTLVGVAVGVAGALALTRILASLLYGVTAADPLTCVLVSLLLGVVALIASYLPARRAARIDPMTALRCE